MKRFILVLALLGMAALAWGNEGDALWTRYYGGADSQVAYAICPDGAGGYVLAGHTSTNGYDLWAVRINSQYDTLWTWSYGGTGYERAQSAVLSDDGNFILAGWTTSFGVGSHDFYVVKITAQGDTLWTRTYGGSGSEVANAIVAAGNDSYLIAGRTTSFGAGAKDMYLVKINGQGDTLWTRTYGGVYDEEANCIISTNDGGFALAGYTWTYGLGGLPDMYLVRIDAQGNVLQTCTYGGPHSDAANSIVASGDGGLVLAGYNNNYYYPPIYHNDCYWVKANSGGSMVWSGLNGELYKDEQALSIAQFGDGGFLMVGNQYGLSYPTISYAWRIDSQGALLWTRTYGVGSLISISNAPNGNFLLAGAMAGDACLICIQGPSLPTLNVTLTPQSPPITIPAAGGSFQFTATVVDSGPNQLPFWVWSRDRFPDGSYTANLLGPVQINPPVGQQVTRLRTQNVPGTWPAGIHWYIGYANPTVAYPAVDADSFAWTKLTTGADSPWVNDAVCSGEPFPGEEVPPLSRGDRGDLVAVSPNPFNPATVLSYQLQATSQVSLRVYDVSGKLVSTLVDGMQEAGSHVATFDGSKLASGLYFVRMQAGNCTAVQKLMLLK